MNRPVRTLIVDDSAFVRHVLTKHLDADPGIVVVGQATNGLDALEKIPALAPDVVTLDVEMPHLDGLSALRRIMAECPAPVIMLSARTRSSTRATVQALMEGAIDFVPKPAAAATGIHGVVAELIEKVKAAAGTHLETNCSQPAAPHPVAAKATLKPFLAKTPLVVIGASTGGPRALRRLLSDLPAELPAAVVIVQHMPPAFTGAMAQRLNETSPLIVKEAAHSDRLACGLALVAPGDFHLQFNQYRQVVLDRGARLNGVRPAVDVAMQSAEARFGGSVIGVILTGMGVDGTTGAGHIKASGGRVIAEHRSMSFIESMPRSVINAGFADRVAPLPEIIPTLLELIG